MGMGADGDRGGVVGHDKDSQVALILTQSRNDLLVNVLYSFYLFIDKTAVAGFIWGFDMDDDEVVLL